MKPRRWRIVFPTDPVAGTLPDEPDAPAFATPEMTADGWCTECQLPITDLAEHLGEAHPDWLLERWPDGGLVIHDGDPDPDDAA